MSPKETYGQNIVVCDTGSLYVKAAVVDGKEVIVPNVVGRYKQRGVMTRLTRGRDDQDLVVGQAALDKAASLKLTYPVRKGRIVDLDDMIKVWSWVFKKLRIKIDDCAIIITEPAVLDYDMRKSLLATMFNIFGFKSILVAASPVLTLHGTTFDNNCTGIGVEIGHDLTQVVAVVNGKRVSSAIQIGNVSGADITDRLAQLLEARYPEFNQPDYRKYIEDVKERFCFVASSPTETDARVATFSHPDGSSAVAITHERHQCMEILFSSDFNIFALIMCASNSAHLNPLKNIAIGGGSSCAPGFVFRVHSALEDIYGEDVETIVKRGRNSAMYGGCALARVKKFRETYLTTREQYFNGDGTELVDEKAL